MVPQPTATTMLTTESTKDYTRFMPPTTTVNAKHKHSTPKMVTEGDKIMKPRGKSLLTHTVSHRIKLNEIQKV